MEVAILFKIIFQNGSEIIGKMFTAYHNFIDNSRNLRLSLISTKSEGRNRKNKEKLVMRILLLTIKMVLMVGEMAEITLYRRKV